MLFGGSVSISVGYKALAICFVFISQDETIQHGEKALVHDHVFSNSKKKKRVLYPFSQMQLHIDIFSIAY